MAPDLLSYTGNGYGPGATANPAPYVRVAYEWNWNGQSVHVGGIFLHSNINPTVSTFASNGSAGQDSYTDYAVDGGYQWIGDGTNVVSVLGILDHENQNLLQFFRRRRGESGRIARRRGIRSSTAARATMTGSAERPAIITRCMCSPG
jgi:hypothetical protein